jgi:hypothetical protein
MILVPEPPAAAAAPAIAAFGTELLGVETDKQHGDALADQDVA